MTYEEAVDALARMQLRGWRLELDRMFALMETLGVPRGGKRDFFHVAGTNGKGSTTSMIQSILKAHGRNVGGYFSPYVYDLRERVQWNGNLIEKHEFAALMAKLWPVSEAMLGTEFGGPTEFEAKTAIGFLYWEEKKCDSVALEVGLGGRLDATNIVDPAVSVIVSIGLDHQKFLGDTHAKIAREKAGIIKPDRPVVLGDLCPEAMEVAEQIARENGSEVWRFGREIVVEGNTAHTPVGSFENIHPSLGASVQLHNAALAIAACAITGMTLDPEKVSQAISETKVPGRMERLPFGESEVILDGAHNAEAAAVLAESLNRSHPGQTWKLVTGMMQGHDAATFYGPLKGIVSRALVMDLENHRSQNPVEVAAQLRSLGIDAEPIEKGTLKQELDGEQRILVTGSFYLLGIVKAALTS